MKFETLPYDLTIPKIGYGTWNVGGGMSPDRSQEARALAAIRHAIQIGYTHIDTAEMYAAGYTEELVAKAIRQSGVAREQLLITTKLWTNHLRYQDAIQACENSLRRLETDYIDLYLIHWPGEVPLRETFRALNELHAQRKILHVGVSNFDLPMLEESRKLCNAPIVTNQVPYSLHTRRYERNDMLAYCQQHDILLTAYTPVEKGRVVQNTTLRGIAEKYDATAIQIALAWLIHQPRVIAIPMSQNPVHIEENLGAADIDLSDADFKMLSG
jgi:diketogulonate reductase-like aldo/keto reductase